MTRSAWTALAMLGGVLDFIAGCAASRVTLPDPPRPATTSELERWIKPPAPAPDIPRPLLFSVQSVALENGLQVTVVTRPGTSSTAIALHVPSMHDPSAGPVTFMGDALRAGTMANGGEVLVNPKVSGARIEVATGRTGTTLSWEVLSRGSARGIQVLGAFALAPAFNPPDVNALLHQEAADIQRYSASNQRMFDLVHAVIPGLERPTPQADGRNLLAMSPEVLRQIHACTMRPEGAELVVVGPVTADEVGPWVKAAFGGWRAGARADSPACTKWLAPPGPLHPEQARLSRAQLQVVVGNFDPFVIASVPGPAPESDDYLPFRLLTRIIHKRSSSATQALRDVGATYGIHPSSDESYAHLSVFDWSGQLEPDRVPDALQAMTADIHGIADSLDAAEVASAARRWRMEIIESLSSNTKAAGLTLWQRRRGRDVRALPSLPDEIARIDRDRCRSVAQHYLSETQPSLGVMGLPERLLHGLQMDVNVQYLMWTSYALPGESF